MAARAGVFRSPDGLPGSPGNGGGSQVEGNAIQGGAATRGYARKCIREGSARNSGGGGKYGIERRSRNRVGTGIGSGIKTGVRHAGDFRMERFNHGYIDHAGGGIAAYIGGGPQNGMIAPGKLGAIQIHGTGFTVLVRREGTIFSHRRGEFSTNNGIVRYRGIVGLTIKTIRRAGNYRGDIVGYRDGLGVVDIIAVCIINPPVY